MGEAIRVAVVARNFLLEPLCELFSKSKGYVGLQKANPNSRSKRSTGVWVCLKIKGARKLIQSIAWILWL